MKNHKNYTLKIFNNRKITGIVGTHALRMFLTRLRSIKWKDGVSTYLRVSYGDRLDNTGKVSTFYNDGYYENEKDLLFAFNAFNEEE